MLDRTPRGGRHDVGSRGDCAAGTAADPAGKTLTLSDDTKFMIPASLKVSRTELKPGAMVKVSYEEKGGQRVVTRLEVMQ